MKKVISLLLLFFAFCGYAHAQELAYDEIVITEPRYMQSTGISLFSAEDDLSAQLYTVIEEGLCSHSQSIDVSSFRIVKQGESSAIAKMDFQEMMDIFCSAVYNHPEYGDLRTALSYSYNTTSNLIIAIIPQYLENYSQAEFDRAADYAFAHAVAPGMNDFDKLLSIHDYLADKITYSSTLYPQFNEKNEPIKDKDGNQVYSYADSAYTSYGALVNDDAVCQGYALAFKLLCDRAGINCGYAVSTAESHMWNVVELDGNFYHVDVTWDDPTNTTWNFIYHKYFLLSDLENMNSRSNYDGYYWTNSLGSCDDTTLHSRLYVADKIDCFKWRGSSFWYECRGILLNGNQAGVYPYSKFFKLSGNTAAEVAKNSYLPDIHLDCEIFRAPDGTVAIDGAAGINADIYEAVYNSSGFLTGISKTNITFDERGRAVTHTGTESKLMLFSHDGMAPLSYAVNG